MSLFNQILETTQENLSRGTIPRVSYTQDVQTIAPAVAPRVEPISATLEGDYSHVLEVEKLPIASVYGNVDNKKGIFVRGKCINVVANGYEVHQPKEILQKFIGAAQSSGLDVGKVLFNPNNGGLLINAKYNDCQIVGEPHQTTINFYTSHCGKYKTIMALNAVRMACFNQVPVLARKKSNHIFSSKHYSNSLFELNNIQPLLEKIPSLIAAQNERSQSLIDKKLKFSDFVEVLRCHLKAEKDSARFKKQVELFAKIYHNAPGQQEHGENAYKAYQAFTYAQTHELRDTIYKAETCFIKNPLESLEFEEVLLNTIQ